MKRKILGALVSAATLMLTACGASTVATDATAGPPPNVVGQQLDQARQALTANGWTVEAHDSIESRMIIVESNWVVTDQAVEGTTVALGAKKVDDETSEPTPSEAATSPQQSQEPSIDAKGMRQAFVEQLGGKSIKSMCDAAYTHWACFFDGVKAEPSFLRVVLTTDGGRSDLREMADAAGWHWFNFIGCQYPDLNTIVVTINGLDYNVFRKDTNADALC